MQITVVKKKHLQEEWWVQPRVHQKVHHKDSTPGVEWAGLNKGRDITVVRIRNHLFRIRIQEEETTKNMLALFKGNVFVINDESDSFLC